MRLVPEKHCNLCKLQQSEKKEKNNFLQAVHKVNKKLNLFVWSAPDYPAAKAEDMGRSSFACLNYCPYFFFNNFLRCKKNMRFKISLHNLFSVKPFYRIAKVYYPA